jgi:hypothetical protein
VRIWRSTCAARRFTTGFTSIYQVRTAPAGVCSRRRREAPRSRLGATVPAQRARARRDTRCIRELRTAWRG